MKYITSLGEFDSIGQAAKAHKVSTETARRRFILKNYPDYQRINHGEVMPKVDKITDYLWERRVDASKYDPGTRPHIWSSGTDPERHKHYRAFCQQRNQAQYRGEQWTMSFDEWFTVWGDKINHRGQTTDSYCMKRLDRQAPWSVNNVHIIPRHEQSVWK